MPYPNSQHATNQMAQQELSINRVFPKLSDLADMSDPVDIFIGAKCSVSTKRLLTTKFLPTTKGLMINKHLIYENLSIVRVMPSSNNFGQ